MWHIEQEETGLVTAMAEGVAVIGERAVYLWLLKVDETCHYCIKDGILYQACTKHIRAALEGSEACVSSFETLGLRNGMCYVAGSVRTTVELCR